MTLRPGDYLLDTSVLIRLQDESEFYRKINPQSRIYVPVIAMGERYYGAFDSSRRDENLAKVEMLFELNVVYLTRETPEHYGRIKAELKKAGKPIPENDLWIAAIAMENDFTVVSFDAHFLNVERLVPSFKLELLTAD